MEKKYILNEYWFHGSDFKSSNVLAIYSSRERAEQAKNEILEAAYPNLHGDTIYIAIIPIEIEHENTIRRSENMTYTLECKGIKEIVGKPHTMYELTIEEGVTKFTILQTKEEIQELVNLLKDDGWY